MVWSLKIVRWFVTDSLPVRRYRGARSVQKARNIRIHRWTTPAPFVTTAGSTGNKLDKKVSRAWATSGTAPKPDFTCIDIAWLRRCCRIANAHKCALSGFVSILIPNASADASAPSQNSMRILDQPLNGNIAISQFQLMECRVAAIRGLIHDGICRSEVHSLRFA